MDPQRPLHKPYSKEQRAKCKPAQAFQVADAKAFLTPRNVNLSGQQKTKTRTAFEYFWPQLEPPTAS